VKLSTSNVKTHPELLIPCHVNRCACGTWAGNKLTLVCIPSPGGHMRNALELDIRCASRHSEGNVWGRNFTFAIRCSARISDSSHLGWELRMKCSVNSIMQSTSVYVLVSNAHRKMCVFSASANGRSWTMNIAHENAGKVCYLFVYSIFFHMQKGDSHTISSVWEDE
jgi:hypothetical protein